MESEHGGVNEGRALGAREPAILGAGVSVGLGQSNASQMQYTDPMKTATLPPVRVDPALRVEMEQALAEGETLTAMVEVAVRHEVQRRQAQAEFVRRGLAAITATRVNGDGLPAADMLARLEARLAAAQRRARP